MSFTPATIHSTTLDLQRVAVRPTDDKVRSPSKAAAAR